MKVQVPLNRGQLARALAVSNRHLGDLIAAGVVAPAVPGKGRRGSVFDALVAVPAALRHERSKRPGDSARDRRDRAQAQLAEQLHRRRAGEVLERDDVERVWSTHVSATRTALLALPRSLAERLAQATTPAETEVILREAIYGVLRHLAGDEKQPESKRRDPS